MVQPVEPFFSNDLEGWAKVAGFLGALILGAWRMLNSDITRRVKVLENEAKTTIERRTVIDVRLREAETAVVVMKNDIKGLGDSFDEFCARQERFMNRIEKKEDEVTAEINKFGQRVASLEGTIRTASTFNTEIAKAIKEVIREGR